MPLEPGRFHNERAPKRLHRARQWDTERLRGKGQSSFNVLMRGSPDARGSEELFVTRGWLEALSLSGSCRRREKHYVLTQGPFPPERALHAAPDAAGR